MAKVEYTITKLYFFHVRALISLLQIKTSMRKHVLQTPLY